MFSQLKTLWIVFLAVGFLGWPQTAPAMSCQAMFSESRNFVQLYHALKRQWYLDLDQFDHGLAGLRYNTIKDIGGGRVLQLLIHEEFFPENSNHSSVVDRKSKLTLNEKMIYELLKNRRTLVESNPNLGEFKRLYRLAFGIEFDPARE